MTELSKGLAKTILEKINKAATVLVISSIRVNVAMAEDALGYVRDNLLEKTWHSDWLLVKISPRFYNLIEGNPAWVRHQLCALDSPPTPRCRRDWQDWRELRPRSPSYVSGVPNTLWSPDSWPSYRKTRERMCSPKSPWPPSVPYKIVWLRNHGPWDASRWRQISWYNLLRLQAKRAPNKLLVFISVVTRN